MEADSLVVVEVALRLNFDGRVGYYKQAGSDKIDGARAANRIPALCLEPQSARLWRGAEIVQLRGKTFAVLCYLVERPGRLVTRSELLDAVWPDSHGAERLPKECIHELREVLEDDASAPRFIETVGRRQGYRFIAPVTTSLRPGASGVSVFKTFPP